MTTPCRGRETGRVRKPGLRGSRLSPRQPKGPHPCHRQPNVRRVVLQLVGGLQRMLRRGYLRNRPEPAPVKKQDQEDQEPPADLNTGTRPYNEGGNLILRASSRGRGNGLANQMPDQASYEVQGQDAHHFEWELFAQVCRRFTLQVEVPELPAQDLRAYTVERMVAPIRPTPDGSFLQMCIMLCF